MIVESETNYKELSDTIYYYISGAEFKKIKEDNEKLKECVMKLEEQMVRLHERLEKDIEKGNS